MANLSGYLMKPKPFPDVCRVCGKDYERKENKHNLLQGINFSVKPNYTIALEELAGPVQVGDNFPKTVCHLCRDLLNQYYSSKADVIRLVNLIKDKLRANPIMTQDKCGTTIKQEPTSQSICASPPASQSTATTSGISSLATQSAATSQSGVMTQEMCGTTIKQEPTSQTICAFPPASQSTGTTSGVSPLATQSASTSKQGRIFPRATPSADTLTKCRVFPLPLQPDEYLTVCGKCGKPSEDHVKCENCGNALALFTFGNAVRDDPSPAKKGKVSSVNLDSIILEGRSVRIGTLRRMATKPVIFTVDYIQLEIEGHEVDVRVKLRSSELTSCEWCSVRKLPVLFLQTSANECEQLRMQLQMSQESGGLWYDCSSNHLDEKYIVLIFESGLSMHEQNILEEILMGIGRANNLSDFPSRLSFDEAHSRLVKCNNATKEKEKFVNAVRDDPSSAEKRSVSSSLNLDGISLECRSVRIGTLRRMVTEPVIFTEEYIQLEIEGREVDVREKVRLRSSELTSCEWCSVRKLPVLFLQTSANECERLRRQLQMSQESGGPWYDCSGNHLDEKYIVLIFESGLSMHEQNFLDLILMIIGRANNLSDFLSRLSFDEANIRLVQYNKATRKK